MMKGYKYYFEHMSFVEKMFMIVDLMFLEIVR